MQQIPAGPPKVPIAFAPVMVEPTAPVVPAIEIVIGAAVIHVPPGVDAATLETVLRVAKGVLR